MRLIVNKNQYNKLIKYNSLESRLYEEWSNYILDKVEIYRQNNILSEEVVGLRNLDFKLKGKNFYNNLPIKNMILNIFKTEGKEKCVFSSIIAEGTDINDIEIDIFINNNNDKNILKNSIVREFFKLNRNYENNNK